jgi:gliding motility-associated-like protein
LLLGNPIITQVLGDNLGSIVFNATGGTPFSPPNTYRYSIDGNTPPFSTDPTFSDLEIGLYPLWVEDSLGCVWFDTIFIGEIILDVTIEVENPKCYGSSSGTITFTMDGTPPYYIWRNDTLILEDWPLPKFIYSGISAGQYFFRIEDADFRRFDTLIIIDQPDRLLSNIDVLDPTCVEYELDGTQSNDGAISVRGIGGVGGYTYEWLDSPTVDSTRTELTAGTYTVTITDTNLCSRTDNVLLEGLVNINAGLWSDPLVAFEIDGTLPDTMDLCYLEEFKLLLNKPYEPQVKFIWEPVQLLNDTIYKDSSYVNITIRGDAEYRVKVMTDQCYDADTLFIHMKDTIGMELITDENVFKVADTLYAPLNLELKFSSPEGYAFYYWEAGVDPITDPELREITFSPTQSQYVIVTGTTFEECDESDTVLIIIQQPIDETFSVFTPNNDGYNDYWQISAHSDEYFNIEVYIFNRWGQQLFSSSHYGIDEANRWYGKSMKTGKDLPIGTYYYIMKPNDGKQEPRTGTVTIVR